MDGHHFDILWRHVPCIHQPDVLDKGTGHEAHWWKLIDDFVTNFNDYQTQTFSHSYLICAYESISRCYGHGGHWINLDLSMYVAMNRKLENGAEIQNAACRK